MKKCIAIFLQIFILTILFCSLNFAQNSRNALSQKSLSKKHIDLKITVVKKRISVGEKIELKIVLRNNFSNPIDLPYMNYDFFAGYQVELTDTNGKVIKPSINPQENKGFGSRMSWEVNTNQEDKRVFTLNDFYALKPGKYDITASRKVNNAKKVEGVFVKSNLVNLIIAK